MNRRSTYSSTFSLAALSALLPALAWGHPGDHGTQDLLTGLAHPFTGPDHLLAMLAVGIWASKLQPRARLVLPSMFVTAMLLGGVLAASGVMLPSVEPFVAASVLVVGLLMLTAVKLPLAISATIVGCFAAFHGFAHMAESGSAAPVVYSAGFMLATLLLTLAGTALGDRMSVFTQRVSGSAIAIAGTALLLSI